MADKWLDTAVETIRTAIEIVRNREIKKKNEAAFRQWEEWFASNIESIALLVALRVKLQMYSSLRRDPYYADACRELESLPLAEGGREIGESLVDTLSSIVGLPFRMEDKALEPSFDTSNYDTSNLETGVRQKVERVFSLLDQNQPISGRG
ncbi:MAG: hypothetical protein KA771_06445 [Spirochaetales bacterium]|nr:hypothetical protein [Spirochaetales bacterium]